MQRKKGACVNQMAMDLVCFYAVFLVEIVLECIFGRWGLAEQWLLLGVWLVLHVLCWQYLCKQGLGFFWFTGFRLCVRNPQLIYSKIWLAIGRPMYILVISD